MSFQSISILGIAIFLSLLAVVRTYPRRRWVTVLVLLIPVIFFSIRWARYRDAWTELIAGSGIALVGMLAWWLLYGRKISPPEESSIRVWSEDDPF
jgi:hypothetical protein